MAYTALTEKGKTFIRNTCNTTGTRLFTGSHNYKLLYASPVVDAGHVWTATPKDDEGNTIATPAALAENLIFWFNKYAQSYSLNANVIAAQAYRESGYILWNFPPNSDASGISQFIMATTHYVVISNKDGSFNNSEIEAITYNLPHSGRDYSVFDKTILKGKENRQQLHQNIMDNPAIMIKAQCSYMNFIADRCNDLASSTLFGYNRGHGLLDDTYTKSIIKAKNYSKNYELEGIKYVELIFKTLFYDFGLSELKMNEPFTQFDADVVEGETA